MSRHYSLDRNVDQIPVRGISLEAIMDSAAFAQGVNDKRTGRSPAYDEFTFDQVDGETFAKASINRHWNYERGRQWAAVAPLSMPLKIDGSLNPKAIALYRAARKRDYVS